MISLFGSSIGALSPWFLTAIPCGAALLVYIFRRKGVANPQITSSLFLLRQLPEYLPSRKRFIPPLQFWLELIACILLALAVSGIFSAQTGEQIAIVIDNSKSMAALQVSGDTRLESARRIAQSDIATSPSTSRFTLLTTNTRGSLTPNTSKDHSQDAPAESASHTLATLKTVAQSYEPDRLQPLLDTLAASKNYDAVWVYTDKERAGQDVNPRIKVITIPADTTSLSNAWIDSVTHKVLNQSGSKEVGQLTVTISSAGQGAQSIKASAICTDRASGSTFSLAPVPVLFRASTTSTVSLGPLEAPWSYCRVQLQSDTSQSKDAITLDDEAWITRSSSQGAITLFSALSPKELGLTSLPYEVAAADTLSNSRNATQAICHRTLPERKTPTIPNLIVMPPSGSKLWSNGSVAPSELRALEVTRWDTSHPLMQYVQPALLSIPSATILTCPDSAKPILFASAGALACAGEEGGVRYVITGFELFPFDGLRSPTVSIFTLNALRWLFSSDTASSGSHQGTRPLQGGALQVGPLALPADIKSVRFIAPEESTLSRGELRNVTISTPGIIALGKDDSSQQDDERLLAANAFSVEESDTSLRHTVTLPAPKTPPTERSETSSTSLTERPEKTHLESVLTLLLLGVLLADLLRRIVTRSRWGGAV